ncbi:DUF1800 domain-containing protein [Thermonema rossianum]|uniref:DUF1800 domain-containing protein n=1 Tax=Thermonema rossianum TaxID=55505 RepID=UPI000571A608|nr:DUF1800 family protein [Thermonema rossianum]
MPYLDPITGNLGERRARHLLRRLTYGANQAQIDAFAGMTAPAALNQLFNFAVPPPPLDESGTSWVNQPPQNDEDEDRQRHLIKLWWLGRMYEEDTALERLTFFLHTVLTTKDETVRSSRAIYYQLQLFRTYLYNDFNNVNPNFNRYTQLIKKICIDNAMLVFLDGRLNEKGNPNENFARELLELFTIGKGDTIAPGNYTNYTEDDIRAAAKALTGWTNDDTFSNIDPDTGLPIGMVKEYNGVAIRHDNNIKTFSSALASPTYPAPQIVPNPALLTAGGEPTAASAYDEISQLIDIIYAKEEAARYLCRKIYRYFVYHEITPDIESNIIAPLAQDLMSNGYRLRPVLERLFSSQHFFEEMAGVEDDKFGAIIKSPLEISIGTLRALRYPGFQLTPMSADPAAHYMQMEAIWAAVKRMGLDFLEPYDVAGYDPYHQAPGYHRNWITTNNLAQRYAFIQKLLDENNGWGFWFDSLAWANDPAAGITDAMATTPTNVDGMDLALDLVRHVVHRFLPLTDTATEFTPERIHYFGVFHLGGLSFANWVFNWNNRNSGNPDISSDTRARLNNLLNAVLQSPEYQLH